MQMASLRADNTRLAAAAESATAIRAEVADMKARLMETQKAAEQHSASVAELTGLNQKLSVDKTALERQLTDNRQAMTAAQAEMEEIKSRMTSGAKATQEQITIINELGASNEKLQSQVKDLGSQVAALRAENTRLASTGEAANGLRAEMSDVKTRLAEAQKSAEQYSATVAELTGANEKLTGELKDLQGQLTGMRADNSRLAQSDAARQDAEQKLASLTAAAAQLASAQRELAGSRTEIARLNETVQALERDRSTRISQLQQENTAIAARLHQAQGTLDQIASAARLINGGGASVAPLPPVGAGGLPAGTPSSATVTPAPRLHAVAEGDTLTRISVRYYGTSNRWQEIYDANKEVLKGENALRPGQRLKIP